jgi:hypothetical protein
MFLSMQVIYYVVQVAAFFAVLAFVTESGLEVSGLAVGVVSFALAAVVMGLIYCGLAVWRLLAPQRHSRS